ncbi:hypothetical protein GCM10011499_01040 [Pelagibacterium lentulum]|uniref:HTH araC/xylS-type domain-containing protein n=1 Tax=Pelagibacterium lentulum TaxID=2029865 RepID=A0A916R5I0_9HYPH|nr:hypothetical protein GCM10011499_01040 [Pelagibacterium lentulum]
MSERMVARLLKAEADLSFGAWRQQVRFQSAQDLPSGGQSVSEAAFAVGYQAVSSFIDTKKNSVGRRHKQ